MNAKKTLVLVLILLVSSASITSCASATTNDVESLKSQIESLEMENEDLKEEIKSEKEKAAAAQTEPSEITSEATIPPETTSEFTAATLNQNIVTADVCEFSISGVVFGDIIEPPNTDGIYSYYEIGDETDTYADVVVALKNLGTSDIEPDDVISVTLKYSEKYTYTGFIVAEDSQGSNFELFPYVNPLSTRTLHCLFEVPDEVATSSDPLECIVKVDGTKYLIALR